MTSTVVLVFLLIVYCFLALCLVYRGVYKESLEVRAMRQDIEMAGMKREYAELTYKQLLILGGPEPSAQEKADRQMRSIEKEMEIVKRRWKEWKKREEEEEE